MTGAGDVRTQRTTMEPMTEPLTEAEVRALDEGTPIVVTWSGGNGPHRYVFTSVDWHALKQAGGE